jgi:TRAP-type C4-dicarboxylate transport system substrate-binding protein
MKSLLRAALFGAAVALASGASVAQTKLKFATFEPPQGNIIANVFVPWAKDVTAASNGALEIEFYPGGSLGRNPVQQLKLVLDGVADMAWVVPGYTPGRFEDVDVVGLPFLVRNSTEASVALTRMQQRNQLGGFDDLKVLLIGAVPPYGIHSKSPIRSVADLKGKRVRATGDHQTRVVEALGGAPVNIGGPGVAEAVSKGVVDLSLLGWDFVSTFKIDEVTSHHLMMPMGTVAVMVPMLKSRYDALPPAAKAALDKHGGEAFARRFGAWLDRQNGEIQSRVAKSGRNTVSEPSAADRDAWARAIGPVNESWRKAKPRNEAVYKAFSEEQVKVREGR